MSIYKFNKNDVLFNIIKAHPKNEFFIYNANVYHQNQNAISGAHVANVYDIPTGFTSLYRLNVDRAAGDTGRVIGVSSSTNPEFNIKDSGIIYPYLEKSSNGITFKTISQDEYSNALPGHVFTGSYDISASIKREFFLSTYLATLTVSNEGTFNNYYTSSLPVAENRKVIQPLFSASTLQALKGTLNEASIMSTHFLYSASIPGGPNRDLDTTDVNLVSIPSIFIGSGIKKGSVSLKYYITGTLVAKLTDSKRNGELVQTDSLLDSTQDGLTAGVVLYNQGFVLLTGSWNLDASSIAYESTGPSKWIYWGYGANDGNPSSATVASASFLLEFSGTNKIPTNTYFATAPRGELNWSNNPTYLQASSIPVSGSGIQSGTYFARQTERQIHNVVSSSFAYHSASFKKVVYINHVNLYDENGLLIGVAKTSKPIRKEEDRDFTFKIKLDM
jgi:hypothetical protein